MIRLIIWRGGRMSKNCHGVLYFHLVWSVKYRKKVITRQMGEQLREIFHGKATACASKLVEFDHSDDHVHLLIKTRPETALPTLVNHLKGYSAYQINRSYGAKFLHWQKGYGAFTVSPSGVPKVAAYIRNQKRHHKYVDP